MPGRVILSRKRHLPLTDCPSRTSRSTAPALSARPRLTNSYKLMKCQVDSLDTHSSSPRRASCWDR